MKSRSKQIQQAQLVAAFTILVCAGTPNVSKADEGGVSLWLPGQFGSLAALPGQPGWSAASIYYHTSVGAGGNVAASRQATIGRLNPTVNINLNANLKADADLAFLSGSYVFAQPVLGGQLALGLTGAFGGNSTSIDGTLTTTVNGVPFTRSGSISDSRMGVADLYPMATLKWNSGVNNYMTYMMGDIPVGTYDSSRLSNFGIGHGAFDAGVGYTYFNPETGHELSVVTGFTYNLKNTDTNYQNGVDWHLDWGLSQFISKQVHIGAVGYFYNQLSADSGAPAILGDNKSSAIGLGPQIGYMFPFNGMQGYLNAKAYFDVDTRDRAGGFSTWLTFAVSPAAATPPAPTHLVVK